MPQMSPLMWLVLLLMFLFSLLSFVILNYSIPFPNFMKKANKTSFSPSVNWKW